MHRQDNADREAGGENQRCGAVTELKYVRDDFAPFVWRADRLDDGTPAKRCKGADEFEHREDAGAGTVDERKLLHLPCSLRPEYFRGCSISDVQTVSSAVTGNYCKLY